MDTDVEVEGGPEGVERSAGRAHSWRRWLLALLVVALMGGGLAAVRYQQGRCLADHSVATIWNEAALDAIRRDFPAPTVHSRNLYHLSVAMWDVWAAYEPTASGVFVDDKRADSDQSEARSQAISFAAYRLLTDRYSQSTGAIESLSQFDETLESLCLDRDMIQVEGSPAAFGAAVADAILDESVDDGSLEASGYVDPSYKPINEPLAVDEPGVEMADPNRWQPLDLGEQITQNGQVLDDPVQEFIGPNWGYVTPFAITPDPTNGLPYDPGPPPLYGTDEFASGASDVAALSAKLDSLSGDVVDISPATLGNVELGTYSAEGWDTNPTTGEPYPTNLVPEADYGRIIAEYWADGPDSETPPGHWNTLATGVGDTLEADGGLAIDGEEVDRLEWDVKVMLAMNGALHDTAIAVWGAKAYYDYARPISMIRYLGQQGLLVDSPGVIETITSESASAGGPHAHLKDHVGEQAVYAWRGEPLNPNAMLGGVGWIRAAEWLPYQRQSFVSPAFAAYVSGHSGFSRSAAEVLTELTGSPFFPGGLATHTVEPGGLLHEAGPTQAVTLQWATYRDAADQAGISRLYGGIHVAADDLAGRIIGAEIGVMATERARGYFGE